MFWSEQRSGRVQRGSVREQAGSSLVLADQSSRAWDASSSRIVTEAVDYRRVCPILEEAALGDVEATSVRGTRKGRIGVLLGR